MGQTEDAKGKWQMALEKEGEVPLSETTSESAPTTPHSGTKREKSQSLETKSGAQTTEPQDPAGIGKPTGGGEGCRQITRRGGHFTCSQDTQGSTAHGIKLYNS